MAWKSSLEDTCCQPQTSILLRTQSGSLRLERSRGPAVIHTVHRACVATRLRTSTWLHVISWLTPGTGRANPQVVSALLRARSREPFSCYGDGFGTATIAEGNRDMTGPYFCALLGSRSICSGSFVQVDRQARCGIGTNPILESTLTFSFSFLRYAWCYLSLTTYTWYITNNKVYLV